MSLGLPEAVPEPHTERLRQLGQLDAAVRQVILPGEQPHSLRSVPLEGAADQGGSGEEPQEALGSGRGSFREMKVLGLPAESTGQKLLPCVFHGRGVSSPSPLGPHRVGLVLEAEMQLRGVWTDAPWRQKPPGP